MAGAITGTPGSPAPADGSWLGIRCTCTLRGDSDMLELGPQQAEFHARLAEPLASASIDLVFCAGPLMKSLWDALPPTRRGGYAETAAELAPRVAEAVRAGDVVMVKGSNGSKAGQVAQALAALGDPSSARPGETR